MKYTKELLETILQEGGATALQEYERYNQRLVVRFRCKCGKEATKRFEMLNLYRNPFCEDCTKKANAEKGRQTCLKKYGVTNAAQDPSIKAKINESYVKNWGDHPKRTKEVQTKWMNTCFEKYGGHPNQNPDVQAKTEENSYRHKDYTLPSGKVVKIQGYEDKALDELLQFFTEEEIVIGRGHVPSISYICHEGIKRIYFPDFFIPCTHTILEIKSEWTLQLKTCRLEEKAKAVLAKGYKYEVWVYDSNKKKKEVLTF